MTENWLRRDWQSALHSHKLTSHSLAYKYSYRIAIKVTWGSGASAGKLSLALKSTDRRGATERIIVTSQPQR